MDKHGAGRTSPAFEKSLQAFNNRFKKTSPVIIIVVIIFIISFVFLFLITFLLAASFNILFPSCLFSRGFSIISGKVEMGGLLIFKVGVAYGFWDESIRELCEVRDVLEIVGNFENIQHWLIL